MRDSEVALGSARWRTPSPPRFRGGAGLRRRATRWSRRPGACWSRACCPPRRPSTCQPTRAPRYSALIEESPVPLLLVRLTDTRICYVNRRASELFEAPAADLIEQPLDASLDDARMSHLFWSELTSKARTDGSLLPFRSRSGRRFWALTNGQLVTHAGEDCAFIGLCDVTAQKLAEASLRRNEMNLRALFAATRHGAVRDQPRELRGRARQRARQRAARLTRRRRRARPHVLWNFCGIQRDSASFTARVRRARIRSRGSP
ncbi:MAG: PAS domain-containing protein [Polyangiaceae bacterium]